jgi:3-hydroxybutyryl-CoA dehydratase
MAYFLEDLHPGLAATLTRTVSDADIVAFAAATGDANPVHLDETFARTTPFAGRIVHGMLSAALISAVLGTELPGAGTIYLSQTLKFRAPVRPGDTVVTTVTVREVLQEKGRVVLETVCKVNAQVVLEGEAVVLAPRRAS